MDNGEKREIMILSRKGPMTAGIGDWIADENGRGGTLVRIYSDLETQSVLLDVQTEQRLVITLKEKQVTFRYVKGE